MFKKFDEKEMVSGVNQAKSSVQKGIRNGVLQEYPHIEKFLNDIVPKKDGIKVVKCHDHLELLSNATGEIIFFRHREGPYVPSLRLLHKYPFILPWMQVDKGAIRFVLSGANIMCPGLTSPGAKMTNVDKETIVAIMAEGKHHAIAVGVTKMTTEEILYMIKKPVPCLTTGPLSVTSLSKNKGIGVDNLHYLNDGLWKMKAVK